MPKISTGRGSAISDKNNISPYNISSSSSGQEEIMARITQQVEGIKLDNEDELCKELVEQLSHTLNNMQITKQPKLEQEFSQINQVECNNKKRLITISCYLVRSLPFGSALFSLYGNVYNYFIDFNQAGENRVTCRESKALLQKNRNSIVYNCIYIIRENSPYLHPSHKVNFEQTTPRIFAQINDNCKSDYCVIDISNFSANYLHEKILPQNSENLTKIFKDGDSSITDTSPRVDGKKDIYHAKRILSQQSTRHQII